MSKLLLTGAREHNLQSVDLSLPHGRWTAVVGPSGSGKTSLVFQTLLREGQRRYLGALSARARHFLGKLGRADLDQLTGLQAPIAVGQKALSASPRSTVGTLTGALDLLRLLFARQAVEATPGPSKLSRSHFSFNTPEGACPACDGLGVADLVAPELLVADPSKSIRDGALRPTLKNGYTVYSQVTLEVMDRICQAHGFDVNTPWQALSPAQHQVILYGTQALKVPFGKHSIESRMKWSGITARPREEGYYRGLIPVIEETLRRDRNPNILRFVRSVPCSACQGSRLSARGRLARVGAWTLPQLLALPAQDLSAAVDTLPPSPVSEAIVPTLSARIQRMLRLGLGHLSLARRSTTLSGGEGQRVRLVAQLSAGLGGQLIALDEPTLGLHPESQAGMAAVLWELRELGNTLVVVEHDPDMVRHAEHLVRLGPGAGPEGGRVLYSGPVASLADPLGTAPEPKAEPRVGRGGMALSGASLHNLQGVDLEVRLGAFNVVQGPSGAGKSSLVFGTLLPALRGESGGPFEALHGVPEGLSVLAIDAKPIGRSSRSTPATWTGLFDRIRKRFAATEQARAMGLSASRFSFNAKPGKDGVGRCPACEGLGVQRVGLHLLEDLERVCGVCAGDRYGPALQAVRVGGRSIGGVLQLSVDEALAHFADPEIRGLLQAMADLGLGYLRLGQSSSTLSRGEGQRIKLAKRIAEAGAKRSKGRALVLMDEPDRGLHPSDVARLLGAIDALIEAGDTVLAISHHRHLWAAADHRVCLRAGEVVPTGPWGAPLRAPRPAAPAAALPSHIHLRGVRTNTLRDLELRIPHGALTVVVGPSGSGKSSLAFGTLAAEATRRFAESLPFQIRRFMRRLPKPELDLATGLTPTVVLAQGQARASRRSTVATQSELGPLMRLLWSRAGQVDGQPSALSAAHFSPDQPLGACPECAGLGQVPRCSPERLILDPDKALAGGAMAGTKPGAFFGEADGQYMATLAAVAPEVDWSQPWSALSAQAQQLALYGAGERVVKVSWSFARGTRSGTHSFEGTWPGLCHLVEHEATLRAHRKAGAAWAAPLVEGPCAACEGARLGARARAVRLLGRSLPEALDLPVARLGPALAPLSVGALTTEIQARLAGLCALGLGHLSLGRGSRSLSEGELQRLRLSSVLRSELTGLTLVLDEPGAGLDPAGMLGLIASLKALVAQGNTVVVVSHRPGVIRAAEHLIELGPGAGSAGGQLIAQGPAEQVLAGDSPTARALVPGPVVPIPAGELGVHIQGARFGPDSLSLPASGLVVLTGPSGSGKTRFLEEVLGASAEAQRPVNCRVAEGLGRFTLGRGRGGVASVVDALSLMRPLQSLFAQAGEACGVPKKAFSFRSPAGRCPSCKGSGIEAVPMDFLADLALPCPSCLGRRYRPEVLAVRWQGLGVDAVLAAPAQSLLERLPPGPLRGGLEALCQLGLGHLSLGRSGRSLSGGEAQRLRFAHSLSVARGPTLHLLDGPGRGLHHSDLLRLIEVIRGRAEAGDLVVAISDRQPLLQAGQQVRFAH